ncbi:hypothetical protein Tco_0922498 [Tanacetum coccineum]|uniref:Uncharacterized protein n=1 Tax=Tanacetum coccineum TaxID=301880 RepID=A0ABQ5D5I7_9ASTR
MSTSTHPIIVLSDSYIEDAFSYINTPDYTPASPNYFPTSSGNTFFDPSEDLSKDLLASLTISPFHDDPYMKVMQAYNATNNESPILLSRAPIAPQIVLPMLPSSPLFDPRDFFLPEEILPHQKRACFLSSSSTDSSAPPQIKTILNHLDELPLERIEHMEDKIEGLGNGRDFYSRDAHRGYPDSPSIYFEESWTRSMSSRTTREDHQTTTLDPCLLPPGFLEPLYLDMINAQDIEHIFPPTPPRDTEPLVGSPISLSPSSSVGSPTPVRSTTPPPDYPFDESIFAELDNSLWIIPRPLKSKPVPEEPNELDAC